MKGQDVFCFKVVIIYLHSKWIFYSIVNRQNVQKVDKFAFGQEFKWVEERKKKKDLKICAKHAK